MYSGVPIRWSVAPSGPSAVFVATGTGAPFDTVTGNIGLGGLGFSGDLTLNFTAGSWLFTVAAIGFPTCTRTFNVTNLALPTPTTIQVTNGTQMAAANSDYAPITAKVIDQYASEMAGVPVTFTMPAGHGTWPGGGSLSRTVVTNGSGNATSPIFTADSTLGLFFPSITAESATGTPVPEFTTINPAVVTSISANSGNNQSTPISTLFPLPLVARAANALNNPVAGASVTFTAPAAGASCTFPTTTFVAISDVNGLATSPQPTANGTTGAYSVSASNAGAVGYFGLTNGAPVAEGPNALSMCEA